jgi:two-component system sensor histidine kinase/response regulator
MMQPSIESARVLVVGEQSSSRELIEQFLEGGAYQVRAARPGEPALATFAQERPQVVVFEGSEAEAATLSTLQRLRTLPEGRAVVCVVLIDSDTAAISGRRALELGADDYLCTPLQRSELLLCMSAFAGAERIESPEARALTVLRAQRDELLRQQRRRDETTALLVHDMKNPLAGAISNAEFLMSAPELDREQRECAQDVVQASRRLHRMVLSVLDVSHSEHGKLEARTERLELNELLRETKRLCWLRLRDKELGLQMELPPERVFVDGDRDMLLRLVANLLDNAIRAAPIASTIELCLQQAPSWVELSIRDHGPSISAHDRALLFEHFAIGTIEDPRSRPRRNLGLRACRVLAEAHGGEVWAKEEEQGATICVRLPRPA